MADSHAAYGDDGNKLPLSPDEVKQTAHDILDKGSLVLVVSRVDGLIACNILGPPERETYDILVSATNAYKKIIEDLGL